MTGRPTKGRPVRFAPGDGATREARPDVVTGLRFTIEPRPGGAVRVDVVDLEPRPLALAFAAALRRSCEPGGAIGAASVAKAHLLAIRRFCGFLRDTAPAVLSPADLRGAHVDDFEGALEAAGMRPIHRHTVLGKVLGSLRDMAADRPGSLDPGLVERLAYTSARSAGRSQPRDAYSPGVARRLRDAAREDVARLFRRLGDRPYAQSDRALRDAAAAVDAVIAAEGAIAHDNPDWRVFYMIHHERGMTADALIDEAHGRHHLLAADLAPLLTLLSLETGLEIECCKALTADCLGDPSAGTVPVAYEKRRARGAERKSIRVRDGGVGTPGGLIRRLIDATAAARRHLGSDRLCVYHSWGRLRAGFGIGAPPTAPWVARHGLVDDDGRPLRLQLSRLRKTHKALWYLKTGGEIARFAVGHTPEVAARCYADVPALRALHRVEQTLLDDYARALREDRRRQPAAVGHLLDVVADFHLYRELLPQGGLRFEPWGGAVASAAGFKAARSGGAAENRTPRMPEAVITPLLAWSLLYVAQLSHDIFAARAELVALEARRDALRAGEAGLTDGERRRRHRDRLAAYFDQLRREGRGVPLWTNAHNGDVRGDPGAGGATPPVNAHLLHLHMGVDVQVEPRLHVMLSTGEPAMVEQAIDELGVETSGFDTVPSAGPGGARPWRPRFDVKTLAEEERMLQAAAYVVCAYLSGMRDCEVQAMTRGCASVDRGEDGLVVRHRIRSTIYKRKATGGEPATWVTIAPVADAVAVLERLAAGAPGAEASDTLWPVLTRQANGKAQVAYTIVRQLNAYLAHLDALAAAAGGPAIPPGPDGQRWRLTTRQFRRTIAWHIANRPFGAVAGMIQYKHASVAAFEGYAGSTASGFRAEIEAERRLGQLDDVLVHFDARQGGGALSGPAGPRVGRALAVVADKLGPLPAMLADRGRLRVLLADLARTLHVGVLADCFFDPSTALCLKHLGAAGAVGPRTALCEPTRCPNACIAERHRPAWARAAAEARTLLREKRLSSPQRLALEREIGRVEAVLDGIDAPPGR